MSTTTKLMVIVGGDVSQAVAAIKQVDSQVAGAASNMNRNAKAAGASFQSLDSAIGAVTGGLGGLAAAAGVGGLVVLATQAARLGLEFNQMAEESAQIEARFRAFGGGAEAAEAAFSSMDAAVGNALDNDEKMITVSRIMGLELAKNAEQAAEIAQAAVWLGDSMDFPMQRIQGLTQVLVTGRTVGLAQYGLAIEPIKARMAELQAATAGMTDQAALTQAVMEAAAGKIALLKDEGYDATTSLHDLAVAWRNLKDQIAEGIGPSLTPMIEGASRLIELIGGKQSTTVSWLQEWRQSLEAQLANANAMPGRNFVEIGWRLANQDALIEALRVVNAEIARVEDNAQAMGGAVAASGDVGTNALLKMRGAASQAADAIAFVQKTQFGAGALVAEDEMRYMRRLAELKSETSTAQNAAQEQWERDQKASHDRIASSAASAYESRMKAASSRIAGYVSAAQSAGKGLFDLGPKGGGMAPGQNGPFENYFRALDVAKQGQASPWASVLGMDQATAARLAGQFQQGLLTPEVISKLIDVDALKQQASLQAQAESLLTAFADQVAASAGVDPKVTKAMLGVGADPKIYEGATKDIAAGLKSAMSGPEMKDVGSDLIKNVADGANAAKSQAVSTVEDIARAMVDGMRGVLGTGAGSVASAVAAGQAAQQGAASRVGGEATGARAGGPTISVGGDSYYMRVDNEGTAALVAGMISERKRSRLNQFMGS